MEVFSELNWWAILVAAGSSFLLGGIWYGPLFKNAWCRAAGVDPDKPARHPGRVFGIAFALSVVAATAFAWMLGPAPEPVTAVTLGALAGLGFVAMAFGINYQFANRPLVLWAIDGGYHTLQFVLFGVVLGLWH